VSAAQRLDTIGKLIENTRNTWASNRGLLPEIVKESMFLKPELLFEALKYFEDLDISKDEINNEIIAAILLDGLSQILYGLDRGELESQKQNTQIQQLIHDLYMRCSNDKRVALGGILHDSGLPINFTVENYSSSGDVPDIAPNIPEFLDALRREHAFSNSYDLYDLIIPQIKLFPVKHQMAFIYELICSEKTLAHDVGVLMLLHNNPEIRTMVVKLMLSKVQEKIFAPIDLRRMLVIRNWLPVAEQNQVDELIKLIKKSGVEPAPHPVMQVIKIMASLVDGAGAQGVLFETKHGGKRSLGGFVVKHKIGIRDPWVKSKAASGELAAVCEENSETEMKEVTGAYVNKIVGHFLHISQIEENTPSPIFLQIQELFGAHDWRPQPLDVATEVARIKEATKFNSGDKKYIQLSMKRSAKWWESNDKLVSSWFESGEDASDSVEQFTDEVMNHDADDINFEMLSTREIMSAPILEKWKQIFLLMLLWHRSKVIKGEYWKDFLIILEQIQSGMELSDIPAIRNIAAKTVAHVMMMDENGLR